MFKLSCLVLLIALGLALQGDKPTATIITGFWDIGRGQFKSDFNRSKEFYLKFFETHLQSPSNMIIFGDESLREFVKEKRKHPNTVFVLLISTLYEGGGIPPRSTTLSVNLRLSLFGANIIDTPNTAWICTTPSSCLSSSL